MTIGIIGLGLIGGSLAKAVKLHTSHTVYGADKDRPVVMKARLMEAIDEELTPERTARCDLLLIALYPQDVIACVTQIAPSLKKDAILIDCCGVKQAVYAPLQALAEKNRFTYIGGHPMAGREFSGYDHSKGSLFENASMILTPKPGEDLALLSGVKSLFLSLGFGHVELTTPEEHDRMIAYTSQLAHVVSSAYMHSPGALHHRGYSAGSFRDMTRVARLNEHMWTELFFDNREPLLDELDVLLATLGAYRNALRNNDKDQMKALLQTGRTRKEQVDPR